MGNEWLLTVYDRDGGILNDDALFDSLEEAGKSGDFWQDDPRFGSYEIERLTSEPVNVRVRTEEVRHHAKQGC